MGVIRFTLTSPSLTMNYLCIDAALQTLLATNPVTDISRKSFETLCWAPSHVCLPSAYLILLYVHDQISQAFPLSICILQAINYW